jgi:hypothetical protein
MVAVFFIADVVWFNVVPWGVVLGVEGSCFAFRDFSSLRTHFQLYGMRLIYITTAYVKHKVYADGFLAYELFLSARSAQLVSFAS